jgi:choline dehydrogenase-like flavoprotein
MSRDTIGTSENPAPGGSGMADDQHYDVVIIGTGAGGGTLGHRLATNGAKVLWLERGPFLPRERDNWQTEAVFVRGKYLAQEVWYDRHGNEFQPEVNYYVGGNTKFYGAALFRLRPEDFGELRHHGGISPAWPISYDDLEPYYTQAEHLYLVHGLVDVPVHHRTSSWVRCALGTIFAVDDPQFVAEVADSEIDIGRRRGRLGNGVVRLQPEQLCVPGARCGKVSGVKADGGETSEHDPSVTLVVAPVSSSGVQIHAVGSPR